MRRMGASSVLHPRPGLGTNFERLNCWGLWAVLSKDCRRFTAKQTGGN